MIREYVNAQQVMHFVDRASPEMTDYMRAEIIGRAPKRIYDFRRQKRMLRETAEHLLDSFDLGYLLYTGDIEIWEVDHDQTGVGKELQMARNANKLLRSQVKYWKARAKRAEKANKNLEPVTPPSPPPSCKEDVRELDNLAAVR